MPSVDLWGGIRGYTLLDKIGEGSFGTVWRATPDGRKDAVAVKRLHSTCAPSRILNEFLLMQKVRGHPSIVQVHQLVKGCGVQYQYGLTMELFEHDAPQDYYQTLGCSQDAARFAWALMSSLAHVHAHGIIHRDVKPTNFMYQTSTGGARLCDFGLAQPREVWQARVEAVQTHRKRHRGVTRTPSGSGQQPRKRKQSTSQSREVETLVDAGRFGGDDGCGSGPASALLENAHREGTDGFRAPEVLLQCFDQSPKIDVWSAGIMLLSMLTGRYRLFPPASNDGVALAHIAAMLGRDKLQAAALACGREVTGLPRVRVESLSSALKESRANWTNQEDKQLFTEALDLVTSCLQLDPAKRISAEAALELDFVKRGQRAQERARHQRGLSNN